MWLYSRRVSALEDRTRDVDRVLADPPRVHLDEAPKLGFAPEGVWSTERELYLFLARHGEAGARTLETGLGVSTVLFALWRTNHVCVVPSEIEVEWFLQYCAERTIDARTVTFAIGWSDEILPSLKVHELDLVLVDGGHGFPAPIIDWYYAGSKLARHGVLVLDDVNVPSVQMGLLKFLDRDPRWTRLATSWKWRAYGRNAVGHLREEWSAQPFLGVRVTRRLRYVPAPLRPLAARMSRRLRRLRVERRER